MATQRLAMRTFLQHRPVHARSRMHTRVAAPHRGAISPIQIEASIDSQLPREPFNTANPADSEAAAKAEELYQQRIVRKERRAREQSSYKFAAIAASLLFTGMASLATYYRFTYNSQLNEAFPIGEFALTLIMIGGGVVAMEMYARWAHRVLWHDFQPGWALHKSHHETRTGPFEKNDIFAVMNAVPAIALTAYGFFTPDTFGGVCFGFGMGITTFGILYMFIHDGLVHRRFSVGPIAEVPVLKRVAMAHRMHHGDKYGGVPFGMFLGPQELEAVGAGRELDRLLEEMDRTEKALAQR